ncbi:MAG: hypothetical protein E7586_03255 [Ruminococcaceae bacterium]|nr:hypothetical protein [Oscillospiraceae bacterium]
MIDKNMLDNLTAKEIKAMIKAKELNIQELNTSALQKLMNYEIDMLCFDEGDLDLIHQCSDLLDKIAPAPMSDEEFMAIVKKAEKEHVVITDNKSAVRRAPRARVLLKRIAVIAAVVIILTTATVGVASAFGVNILEELYKISLEEDGAKKDIEGFTFYHSGEAKYYSSLEEIIEEKNWDILYPTKFPENVKIDKIMLDKSSRGNDHIYMITNDKNISIGIERNAPNQYQWEDQDEFYVINEVKYHVYQRNNALYCAVSYYNGDYYSIQAGNYEDLILIIDNLKEIEK